MKCSPLSQMWIMAMPTSMQVSDLIKSNLIKFSKPEAFLSSLNYMEISYNGGTGVLRVVGTFALPIGCEFGL